MAELEAMLGDGKGGGSRNGLGGLGNGEAGMGSAGTAIGNGFPQPQGPPLDFSNLFAGNGMTNFGPSPSGGVPPSQAPTPSFFPQFNNNTDISIEDTFDFSMLDPNCMNLVNTFADTLDGYRPFRYTLRTT